MLHCGNYFVQLPVENSVEKTLCCWLCTSGPISITARTDRRGYCPGEWQGLAWLLIMSFIEIVLLYRKCSNSSSFSLHFELPFFDDGHLRVSCCLMNYYKEDMYPYEVSSMLQQYCCDTCLLTTGIVISGESIAISADFENYSSRIIIPYATLHQTQTFFANGKSRIRGTKFTVLTGELLR